MTYKLDPTDLAIVAHLRRDYRIAGREKRTRLRAINEEALSEGLARRKRLLRELTTVERSIAMREAIRFDENEEDDDT